MNDLIQWIQKQAASELTISLGGLKSLSQESTAGDIPTFHVGDKIEFDIVIKNNNPFPLGNLNVTINQVEAVEFEENPTVGYLQSLKSGEEQKVATIKGTIIADPDDAKSPFRILDYVCRVTVSGAIDLPPIEFLDEEFEVVFIRDA